MKPTNVQLLRVVFLTAVLAVTVTPASALAPEGETIAFGNLFGQLVDCVRIRPCSAKTCEARAIYSRADGVCTRSTRQWSGSTRMTCSFEDVSWSSWATQVDEVVLDITCSDAGKALYHLHGKYSPIPRLSCAAVVSLSGGDWRETRIEGYYGLSVPRRRSCRRIFGWPLTYAEWQLIDLGWFVD